MHASGAFASSATSDPPSPSFESSAPLLSPPLSVEAAGRSSLSEWVVGGFRGARPDGLGIPEFLIESDYGLRAFDPQARFRQYTHIRAVFPVVLNPPGYVGGRG